MIGTNAPQGPLVKATDKDGKPYAPPDNSAEVYAAVVMTSGGVYVSVWSLKASVWVRLLNRFNTVSSAIAQIERYGWVYWDMAVPPHSRDLRRQRIEQASTKGERK